MGFTPEAWARLGALFRDARDRLGMSRAQFAKHAGISEKAIYNAEKGKAHNQIPPSFARYAAGLDWTPDSIWSVLNGHDPQLVSSTETDTAPSNQTSPAESALLDLLTRVHEFGRLAVHLGASGTIRDELDATAQRLVQSIPRSHHADAYDLAAYRPHAPGEGPADDDAERILRAMENDE